MSMKLVTQVVGHLASGCVFIHPQDMIGLTIANPALMGPLVKQVTMMRHEYLGVNLGECQALVIIGRN
jgi:hypothetical protein